MAFLNGHYTAFDPNINILDITATDDNFIVYGYWRFNESGTEVTFFSLNATQADIQQAIQDGKQIWFTITPPDPIEPE